MKKLLLLVLSSFLLPPALAQNKMLTIDDVYHPEKELSVEGATPNGFRWLKDGEHYLQRTGRAAPFVRVDAVTGQQSPVVEADQMEAAFRKIPGLTEDQAKKAAQGTFTLSPDESGLFLYLNDDLYYYSLARRQARRLTNSPGLEREADFSPDGKNVAFVRDNDLYIVDVEQARETRLTKDGTPRRLNGILDWVYQEEVYGRGDYRSFWWSPDSTRLAFLQLDETDVPTFPVVALTDVIPELEQEYYPQSGDPNPKARLGVISIPSGQTRWVDQSKYPPEDEILIVRVSWTPDSRILAYQVQNREQTWLDLNAFEPAGKSHKTLLRETSGAWVDVIGQPIWLQDGSFLWESARTGYPHIYHYAANGKLIRAVTSGDWTISRVYGADSSNGWVYFAGQPENSIDQLIYRIKLDGTGLIRLTEKPGWHSAKFNNTFTLFADTWSDAQTPQQATLYRTEKSQLIRWLVEPKQSALKDYRLSPVEFMLVKTPDGFLLQASMIKPPDFDPTRKYPVLVYTYGGPEAPSVRNSWGGRNYYLWHQFLAQQGYIIWGIDPRSSSAKSFLAWPIRHDLGALELRDIEASLNSLKQQPYIDGTRIGIWGWSYGGFMTAYALTHSTSFKIGIAGAPVTDWRLYDSIYTERYMGLPAKNREAYEKTSVVKAAKNIHGRLLLIHGLIDDNVHTQNSIMLMYQLQQANKDFDVMFYPNSRHGVTMPKLVYHMRRLMTEFILKNL
jgi:dipeptidyl-peptidase-4